MKNLFLLTFLLVTACSNKPLQKDEWNTPEPMPKGFKPLADMEIYSDSNQWSGNLCVNELKTGKVTCFKYDFDKKTFTKK